LRPILLSKQSPIQRGFTEDTSPINAAVIFEEVYREFDDQKNPFYYKLSTGTRGGSGGGGGAPGARPLKLE
jgi:hypothetical protein